MIQCIYTSMSSTVRVELFSRIWPSGASPAEPKKIGTLTFQAEYDDERELKRALTEIFTKEVSPKTLTFSYETIFARVNVEPE